MLGDSDLDRINRALRRLRARSLNLKSMAHQDDENDGSVDDSAPLPITPPPLPEKKSPWGFLTDETTGIFVVLGLIALGIALSGPFFLWKGFMKASEMNSTQQPTLVRPAQVFEKDSRDKSHWVTVCWSKSANVATIPITEGEYNKVSEDMWIDVWALPSGYGRAIALSVPPAPYSRDYHIGTALTFGLLVWPACFYLLRRKLKWEGETATVVLLGPSLLFAGVIFLIMPEEGVTDPRPPIGMGTNTELSLKRINYIEQMTSDDVHQAVRTKMGDMFEAFQADEERRKKEGLPSREEEAAQARENAKRAREEIDALFQRPLEKVP